MGGLNSLHEVPKWNLKISEIYYGDSLSALKQQRIAI